MTKPPFEFEPQPTPRTFAENAPTQFEPLNDEANDRDRLAIDHAFPPTGEITKPAQRFDLRDERATVTYTTTDGTKHVDTVPITRRGIPIVPEQRGKIHTHGASCEAPHPFENFSAHAIRAITEATPPDRIFASVTTPASHNADPHTSQTAAASVTQSASRHRVAILTALTLYGPATGHELAQRLALTYTQVAKRLSELHADDRIQRRQIGTQPPPWQETPVYQTRNSPTGHPACVWHLNPLYKPPQSA